MANKSRNSTSSSINKGRSGVSQAHRFDTGAFDESTFDDATGDISYAVTSANKSRN